MSSMQARLQRYEALQLQLARHVPQVSAFAPCFNTRLPEAGLFDAWFTLFCLLQDLG